MSQVTIGITTRNRPRAVARCLRSLASLGSVASRVIVFDDASDDPVLRLGGSRASLGFYGEEKDFCIRVLDAGMRVVYLPDALVCHVPDPGGRDTTRYVRFVIRNDCLYSMYNEPWPLVVIGLPVRLLRYRRMVAGRDAKPGGMRWIVGELKRLLPEVRRQRRAVAWSTIREWRRLARTTVPYERRQEAGARQSSP
jgi:GT2 family glycosyltransferase